MKYRNASLHQFIFCCFTRVLISQMGTIKRRTSVAGGSSPLALFFPLVLQVMCCINIKEYSSNQTKSCQEQLEHAEVSTALRYLGQYYFKNKLYDEASLCAQRCCDYNDVSVPVRFEHLVLVAVVWSVLIGHASSCRHVRKERLCCGRSHRSEIKSRHLQQTCLHHSQTTTLQSGGCLPWISSHLHPDTNSLLHWLKKKKIWTIYLSCDMKLLWRLSWRGLRWNLHNKLHLFL